MKNTFIIVILGVILIITAGFLETVYIEKITENLKNSVLRVENLYNLGYTDKSIMEFDDLIEEWEKDYLKLAILVVHGDIDKIEECLTETSSLLKNNFFNSQISANFALLKMYIENISEGNKFTLENVL